MVFLFLFLHATFFLSTISTQCQRTAFLSTTQSVGSLTPFPPQLSDNEHRNIECINQASKIYAPTLDIYLQSMRIRCNAGTFEWPNSGRYAPFSNIPHDLLRCAVPAGGAIEVATQDGVNNFYSAANGKVLVVQDYPHHISDIVYFAANPGSAVKGRCAEDDVVFDVVMNAGGINSLTYKNAPFDISSLSRLCPTGTTCNTEVVRLRGLIGAFDLILPRDIRNSHVLTAKCAFDEILVVGDRPYDSLQLVCSHGTLQYTDSHIVISDFPQDGFKCVPKEKSDGRCEVFKLDPRVELFFSESKTVPHNSIKHARCLNNEDNEVSVRCINDIFSYFSEGIFINATDLCPGAKVKFNKTGIALLAVSVVMVLSSIGMIVFCFVKKRS